MSDDITAASNSPYVPTYQSTYASESAAGSLASRGYRLTASVVDTIVLLLLLFAPAVLFAGGLTTYVAQVQSHKFLWGIGGFLFSLTINGFFLSRDGQTIGKKVVGIRIVRTDGSQASLGRIVGLRMAPLSLLQLVPVVGRFFALIDVLFIFRESKKCLHDQVADTIVINVK